MKKSLRFEIFRRDAFTCQYCGTKPPDVVLEVDHVLPRVEGGTDDPLNLVTACFNCNNGKGRKLLEQGAIEQDADPRYLETQQEIAEIERYQRSLAAREEAIIGLMQTLQELWCDVSALEWHPNDRVMREMILRFDPDTIEAAIRDVAPKVASGYLRGDRWVGYLKVVARNITEGTQPDD